MKLTLKDDGPFEGFVLRGVKNVNELPEHEEIEALFPEVSTALDNNNRIVYFHVDLWAGPDFLDHIISYLEEHPVPGTYTVEQLGLYDVPFVEVLKTIKKLYEQKLTTPTRK